MFLTLDPDLDLSITSGGCHLNAKGDVHAEDVIAQLHRLLHDGNLTSAYTFVLQVTGMMIMHRCCAGDAAYLTLSPYQCQPKIWPRVKTALRLPPSAQAENQFSALFPGNRAEIYFPPPFRPFSGKKGGNYKIRPVEKLKKESQFFYTISL